MMINDHQSDQSHPVMDPFAARALVTDPASEAFEVLLDRKPDKNTTRKPTTPNLMLRSMFLARRI